MGYKAKEKKTDLKSKVWKNQPNWSEYMYWHKYIVHPSMTVPERQAESCEGDKKQKLDQE